MSNRKKAGRAFYDKWDAMRESYRGDKAYRGSFVYNFDLTTTSFEFGIIVKINIIFV